jgi:hypothetical protein
VAARGDPFALPPEPRGGLDLLRWTFLELPRLENFSRTLSRGQTGLLYVRAAPWIALIATAIYLATILLTAWLDLPLRFPDAFTDSAVTAFSESRGLWAQVIALSSVTGQEFLFLLAFGLAGGLAGGLAVGLAGGLALGLAGGLAFGPAFGLAGSLAFGLAGGLAFGLAVGLAGGLAFGLAVGLAGGLAGGLAVGLAGGLAVGLEVGLALGIGFFVGWVAGFLRLPLYLWQSVAALFRLDLRHNPHLWDAGVRLPIWRARRRLTEEAVRDPDSGAAFADFLLEHRPLQRGLAADVLHAVSAGRWRLSPLTPEVLDPTSPVADEPEYSPSAAWLVALATLRVELAAAREQTQPGLRLAAHARFEQRLQEFRALTLRESPRWSRHYLEPLDVWLMEAGKERRRIEQEAEAREPIAANPYRPGTALRPETGADVFFGREDVRDALAREVYTAREMPLFLIQGQRRVGKTSLLYFLPALLGPGFQVVRQDIQDSAVTSVTAWMADLRRRAASALDLRADAWEPPADWVRAWFETQAWLAEVTNGLERKLILAMDEYETLHPYLQQDPAQGRRLLAGLRSFSQHQNRVVLLFSGATPFSELRDPDWSEFFVQAVRLRVDYLRKPDALRLITEPVPLDYPDAVKERLFEITQGHPALLQSLCKRLVDVANREGRRKMQMGDLAEAIERAIDKETPAMERFWNEFCRSPECRAAVECVLAGREPEDRLALLRLDEHGYVIQRDGCWRMRVPLFEDWLLTYRQAFP